MPFKGTSARWNYIMYKFEDGKSVFILIWNICISKPAAMYPVCHSGNMRNVYKTWFLKCISCLSWSPSLFLLRPLPILGVGMVVLGSILLLTLLIVRNQKKVDPLFYGTTHTSAPISELQAESCLFHCASSASLQRLRSFLSPAWWDWRTLWSRTGSSPASWASTWRRWEEDLH